jgi:hypothetical protein
VIRSSCKLKASLIDLFPRSEVSLFFWTNSQRSPARTLLKPQVCGRDGINEPAFLVGPLGAPASKLWQNSRLRSLRSNALLAALTDTPHADRIDHEGCWVCKREQVLLYLMWRAGVSRRIG